MSDLDYGKALLLGLVQGLTEFLPVSSSGHLVIIQQWFKLEGAAPSMLLFDVFTHVGTLFAVLVVFATTLRRFVVRAWREFGSGETGKRIATPVVLLGLVACIPTAAIGLFFQRWFEQAFDSLTTTGVGLLLTACLLFVTGRVPRPRRGWRRFGWWRAAMVGVAQGAAISPGVSRSGSTICLAMLLGMKRRWAAEFSFLIAVPAIAGAGVLKMRETLSLPHEQLSTIPWGPILAGSVVSFCVGVVALRLLLRIVVRDKLHLFSYYCFALGVAVLCHQLLGW